MKKIIFTLLIIHCSLIIANAQWVQVHTGKPSYATKHLCFAVSGSEHLLLGQKKVMASF